MAGYQVLLHNGAFFQNQQDMTVDALAFPVEWTRHWRGKLTFNDGGIIGDGWDFGYNKRIVPIAPLRLSNGLFAERLRIDKAALTYYNGQDRADVEQEIHSEERDVFNFDTRFQAWVTTYKAPIGSFHEIERYILSPGSPHPFAGHVNVEPFENFLCGARKEWHAVCVQLPRTANLHTIAQRQSQSSCPRRASISRSSESAHPKSDAIEAD